MVATDMPFQASNEDWLQNSVMVVKNVSKKEIVAIWVSIFFPESNESGPMVADQISLGNPPPEGMYSAKGEKIDHPVRAILSLLPGKTLDIPLGQNYEGYSNLLKQRKTIESLTVCHVRMVNVYFSDGMKWSPGYFGRPDPDHIGKYIRILPSQFYEYHPQNEATPSK